MPVPIIDLFAGPGGLGEGFSQIGWRGGNPYFRIGLSVEKDPVARRTLKLISRGHFWKCPLWPDSYTVIISRSIAIDPNVPGLLPTLTGRAIIPPNDRALWPAQEYLHEHRRAWRL